MLKKLCRSWTSIAVTFFCLPPSLFLSVFLPLSLSLSPCLSFSLRPHHIMTDLLYIKGPCPCVLSQPPPSFIGLYKPHTHWGALTSIEGQYTLDRSQPWITIRTISRPTVPHSPIANLPVNLGDPPWWTWATLAKILRGTIWSGHCATPCTLTSAAWDSWLSSTLLRLVSVCVCFFNL